MKIAKKTAVICGIAVLVLLCGVIIAYGRYLGGISGVGVELFVLVTYGVCALCFFFKRCREVDFRWQAGMFTGFFIAYAGIIIQQLAVFFFGIVFGIVSFILFIRKVIRQVNRMLKTLRW